MRILLHWQSDDGARGWRIVENGQTDLQVFSWTDQKHTEGADKENDSDPSQGRCQTLPLEMWRQGCRPLRDDILAWQRDCEGSDVGGTAKVL